LAAFMLHWRGMGELARKSLRAVCAATMFVAVAFVLIVPLLRASESSVLVRLGLFGHLTCTPFCHQLPERCFWLAGYPMPLCARCFGIVSGSVLGLIAWLFWPGNDLPRLRQLFWVAVAIVFSDWLLNYAGLYKVDLLRWATGALIGACGSLVVMQGLDAEVRRGSCPKRYEVFECTSSSAQ